MARYRFKQWSDGNTLQERELTNVQADINLSAEFQQIFRVTLNGVMNKGKVAVNNSPFTYSQYADLDAGTSCTLKAQPDSGYIFLQWSDGNTDQIRTIASLSADINLSAEFTENVHDVRLYVEDNTGGKVKIDSGTPGLQAYLQVLDGDSCQISAIPDSGYAFQKWSDGDTNAVRTLSNIDDDVTLEATFIAAADTVHIKARAMGGFTEDQATVKVSGCAEGSTSEGDFAKGSTVVVEAFAKSGCMFSQWGDGYTQNPRTYANVQDNLNIYAMFDDIGDKKKLQITGEPALTLTVNGAQHKGSFLGYFDEGENVVVTIPGYTNLSPLWSDGNTDMYRTFTINADTEISCELVAQPGYIKVTINQNDQNGGMTSINTNPASVFAKAEGVADGSDVTLKAIAGAGYLFVRWEDGSTNPTRVITAIADEVNAVAVFDANPNVKVIQLYGEFGKGDVKAGDSTAGMSSACEVTTGGSVQIQAIPQGSYVFVKWSDNDTNATRTLTNVTENITLQATFASA